MPDWIKLTRGLHRSPDVAEELAQHAEDRYAELLASGTSEAAAQAIVMRELTGRELQKHSVMFGLGQDLRYAFRTLWKSPGFTLVAMLALALGIGANTAIFSVVNGVLLQPLAYPEASRLMKIANSTSTSGDGSVAYPNYLDWRRRNASFTDMGSIRGDDFNFTGSGQPEQLAGAYVSASLFPVLGVAPAMGRNFLSEEDRPGAACPVILSHGFWQARFGSDGNILGRILTLNGVNCTVVGVMPAHFRLRSWAQVYLPIEQWPSVELHSREAAAGLNVIGRLKPGVTMEAAQAEMKAICAGLALEYPKEDSGRSAHVVRMKDDMVQYIRPTLYLLMGAVGFVLIIACANVANLLLARATARKREFAIRAALGAERWRMIRQLLTESVVLSIGAAGIGLLLARWGTAAVLAAVPGTLPRAGEIGIDPAVLAFTLGISILTGILFGLAPAFQGANTNPQESLKEGARGAGGGRHRTEGVFVALETGLAVVLLAGAGLMMQSVWRLLQVDPGFHAGGILTMRMAVSPKVMTSPTQIRLAYRQIVERVAAIAGAQSVTEATWLPLNDGDSEIPYWAGTGPQPPLDRMTEATFNIVSPDYLNVIQAPLRRGRFFTDRDTVASPPVIVIDEVLAGHLFHGQDPLGKQISVMMLGPAQIVGVAAHVKQWGLDLDDTSKIRDQIYFPIQQVPDKFMSSAVSGLSLAVRTAGEPLSLAAAVRQAVAGPTQDQPVYEVRTMEQIISASVAERRFTMLVLIIFGAVALLLAAVGIYGVMSYTVTRRVHEIGIRSALGASRREILAMVLRQGMKPAGIGMGVGLVAALALTRLMAGLLYGVGSADPLTLVGVLVVLGMIALVACYIPARRATAVDPVIALRWE